MSARTVGGRYRLERSLGHGGMATVHLARDEKLGREVAIKRLSEALSGDEIFRERFMREARTAAGLSHPNIVGVFDVGEEEGIPYIVMECVDGRTLAELLAENGPLDPDGTVDLILQACAGLEHAHRAGLVHRDVKPANLLLTEDGTLKVADFGIAHAVDGTRVTEVGTVLGTAAYLPPEQALGDAVTPASDLYSLGTCLYELLAGEPPFAQETLGAMFSRREAGPPPRLEGVPPRLDAAIMSCLERDPKDRPASAAELARLLAASPATAVTRVTRFDGTVPRRTSLWAAVLAAVAVAAVVGALALREGDEPGTEPVPRGDAPAQDYRNLADWLREQAKD